jgi:protein-tyrosine phosphatase
LYIGSYSATFDVRRLKSLGISAVLNLAGDKYPLRHPVFEYASLRMPDSPCIDISPVLRVALDFIEANIAAGKAVMVHCVKGLSRAPTVACAYLMWKQSIDFTSAISIIKASFPEADPNLGFVSQLEGCLHGPPSLSLSEDANSPHGMRALRLKELL